MRRILIPVLLAMMAFPSWAAKRLTVVQFERMLATERAAHKSDLEVARKIAETELAERLTDVALGRLNQQFATGSPPAIALLLLADRSAFLDPPVNELPATPAPSAATQQQLLQAAKRFAVETLPHLPNLIATRTTFSFDDSPQEVTKGGYLQRVGLHLIGSSKAEVSVRSEREDPSTHSRNASSPAQGGLITWGEFGSTLLIILSDSSQGEMTWSHWEQTASGLAAVFHYQVPKGASHYEIDTPTERIQPNGGSNRWARTGGIAATRASSKTAMVRSKPGYQGSLWIDPATGTILRVTLVADLKGNSTLERGAILVEYGPVPIADKKLICPVRSLALSSAPATVDANFEGTATEWLNENLFSDYHMFASSSRIVDEQSTASPLSPVPAAASAPDDLPSPVAEVIPSPETAPAMTVPQPAVNPPFNAPSAPPAEKPETPPAAPANATGSVSEQRSAASQSPAATTTMSSNTRQTLSSNALLTPPSDAETLSSAPSIKLNVNRILVPVVVRDKQGRSVADLKKEDFEVFDEGKPRPVSAFSVERRGTVGTVAAIAPEPDQQSPAPGSSAVQSSLLPERITVLLFDDLHMTFEDTSYVQKAASRAFDATLSSADIAAVISISGKVNSGLTRDRSKLQAAIMSLRPPVSSVKEDCPKIDYYQADLIENKHDPAALSDVVSQIMNFCGPGTPQDMAERLADSAAMRVLSIGKQDTLVTYITLKKMVLKMATLPGQHTLLLVSDGFLPLEQEARLAESQVIDLALRSNVIINAIDARGLYTASLTAGEDTRGRNPSKVSDYRRSSMTAAEQSIGELADGTGGRFFHNNNDLDAGFKAITEAPEIVYMLELPLDGVKAKGGYHRLQVKVDRQGMDVQARRGYFKSKQEEP